jgi:hypothetical protein
MLGLPHVGTLKAAVRQKVESRKFQSCCLVAGFLVGDELFDRLRLALERTLVEQAERGFLLADRAAAKGFIYLGIKVTVRRS